MISQKITVTNKTGLHARPANNFVKETKRFKSDVQIVKNGKTYNGKSILSLLSASVGCNTEIELITNGEDEREAMKALTEAIRSGLGE